MPEILKKSLHSCSVRGGEEVFIIGKNFLKGTKVVFQENIAGAIASLVFSFVVTNCISEIDMDKIIFDLFVDDNSWQAEAKIDMDLFHQVYMQMNDLHSLLFLLE